MRKGNYLNKNTGKVIKKLEDIDGPVVHVDEPEVEVAVEEVVEKEFVIDHIYSDQKNN